MKVHHFLLQVLDLCQLESRPLLLQQPSQVRPPHPILQGGVSLALPHHIPAVCCPYQTGQTLPRPPLTSLGGSLVCLIPSGALVSCLPGISEGNSVQKGQAPAPTLGAGSPVLSPITAHFVDQHRAALILRVTNVDEVLDALYGKVLTEEQYQAVRAETTNPTKMRKLFSFAPAWNLMCKDLLLQALRDTQPFLVTDLEQS